MYTYSVNLTCSIELTSIEPQQVCILSIQAFTCDARVGNYQFNSESDTAAVQFMIQGKLSHTGLACNCGYHYAAVPKQVQLQP